MTLNVDELQVYLDSTLQTEKDLNLNNIRRLLNDQQTEKSSLDAKLQLLKQETSQVLSTTLQDSEAHQAQLDKLSTSLDATQDAIESAINQPALFSRLVHLEHQLKELDTAKTYIKALLVASDLSSQAIQLVTEDPQQAITPYAQLVHFEHHLSLHSTTSQSQGLFKAIQSSRQALWQQLNQVLTQNFTSALQDLNWPTPLKPPYGPQLKPKLAYFEKTFSNLLNLQDVSSNEKSGPISIMLDALSLRFRFHFESSKPTNRLDKPEWYFSFIQSTIAGHLPFFLTTIQPLLPRHQNAKDQLITGLLVNVQRKLRHTLPKLVKHPNWLSHTVHEALLFDQSLIDTFAYSTSHGMMAAQTILQDNGGELFRAWFEAERSFANVRFDEIIQDPHVFDITTDASSTTTSAVRLVELLESVTEVYRFVPTSSQRAMFLNDIQISLLSQYQKRLASAMDSFEALSLIRSSVPGALPETVTGVVTTETTAAVYRLYRWWRSAEYVMDMLKDWSEDEFFLELQVETNQQDLFKDMISSYDHVCARIEKAVIKLVMKEWNTNAKKYIRKDTWWQQSILNNEISDELYPALQDFRTTFNYLHRILSEAKFLSVYRKTLKEIEDWYWKKIITQNQFSTMGALQLETDVKQGLWKIGQGWVKKPENLTKRLKEAVQLLTLPFDNEDTVISYDQLMKALTDTNQLEYVQQTLQTMGIEILSNGQIRDVLRRRNDMLHSWN